MKDLKNFFRGKKVLITGHTGFKGAWLARTLLNWGAEVVGISLVPHTTPSFFGILGLENVVKNYFADIRDFRKLKDIVAKEKPDIVVHLAAQALVHEGYNDPLGTISTNVVGTANLLEVLRQVGSARAAVIITTDKVYAKTPENSDRAHRETDPLGGHDPYASSKAAADMISSAYIGSFFNAKNFKRNHNTLVAVARSGNVIGGGDWGKHRLVPDIVRNVYGKDKKLIIRNPHHVRPWEYVLEPLYGYLLLARELHNGNTDAVGAWNFGPDERSSVPVNYILDRAIKAFEGIDYEIVPDVARKETETLKLDNAKAKEKLKWSPKYDINAALALTFDWYKSYYKEPGLASKLTDKQIELFFSE